MDLPPLPRSNLRNDVGRRAEAVEPDPARIDMAMGILGPLEANAPTDACYRIIGLKAMLSLAMGDGEKARELAEQAIGYDASDRFASSVLDRLPETDPAMEAANVWENGGHLGR